MRQAGRSLPEYRAARAGIGMLDACLVPDLVTEITLQPVRRHKVDAAIFFSDIVVPAKLAGVELDIVPGRGPVVAEPIRTAGRVARLRPIEPDAFAPIDAAVRATTAELGATPLIGFAGAPFTVASYLVEGGPSRDHLAARTLMYRDPDTWHALARWAADGSIAFLRAQIAAGASAIQLFDSWAGALSLADYREFVAPHSARVFEALQDTVPRIHFGLGTGHLLGALRAAGADVVGVDHRTDLAGAIRTLGGDCPVQGNLDPALLFAPEALWRDRARAVVVAGRTAPGHIFNLGHGVPPSADPAVLTALVEEVHAA